MKRESLVWNMILNIMILQIIVIMILNVYKVLQDLEDVPVL
jgi:hypothetical protein